MIYTRTGRKDRVICSLSEIPMTPTRPSGQSLLNVTSPLLTVLPSLAASFDPLVHIKNMPFVFWNAVSYIV